MMCKMRAEAEKASQDMRRKEWNNHERAAAASVCWIVIQIHQALK